MDYIFSVVVVVTVQARRYAAPVTLEDPGDGQQGPLRPAVDGSDIHKLGAGEVPRIAGALARAFEDDPVMTWIYRSDSERQGRLERLFTFFLRRIWLRHDECYATERLFGAALWLPPGEWHLGPLAQLRLVPGMVSVMGRSLPRGFQAVQTMEKRHPADPPHYYLPVLGVEPEFQGRGFGSALLQPVLGRCDRDGVPAYLESSKRRNVVLYERHGFRVVEELRLPKGGPPIWRMWRDPA
jgi:ribosomal protein S18 acetylase RimI-like enzyme